MTRRLGWILAIAVGSLLVLSWFPLYGPPHFRYTGSDPAREVWNFGLPFAHIIFDPIHGIVLGPTAYLVLPVDILALILVLVYLRARASQRRSVQQ